VASGDEIAAGLGVTDAGERGHDGPA
jgi:hypothetical protein